MKELADAPELLTFLRDLGADRVSHSGRTFLDHLVGTANVLKQWGARDALWKAGLFHSIYGTAHFRRAALPFSARERVEEAIGPEAERLAFVFCAFDRRSLYAAVDRGEPYAVRRRDGGDDIAVTPAELRDLACLLWSNEVEQLAHVARTAQHVESERRAIEKTAHLLPERAVAQLREIYAAWPPVEPGWRPGLKALLDGADAEFKAAYLHARPFVARGAVQRLKGLANFTLEELIESGCDHIKASFQTLDDRSSTMRITAQQAKELYETGFTLHFHGLRGQGVERWVEALDGELGLAGGTRVSACASRKGFGTAPHYEGNDVFLCQVRGQRRWRLAANEHVKYPSVRHVMGVDPPPAEARDGLPREFPSAHEVIEATPGTVMFVPRGTWQASETLEGASLHFTIQWGLPAWSEIIEFLVLGSTLLTQHEDLREPAANAFEEGHLRAGVVRELQSKLELVASSLADQDLDLTADAMRRFLARRRPF